MPPRAVVVAFLFVLVCTFGGCGRGDYESVSNFLEGRRFSLDLNFDVVRSKFSFVFLTQERFFQCK